MNADQAAGPVGILLAAGNSSRFGSDKRWHRLADGTPMALRAAMGLRAACPRTVVVLRQDDDELAARCVAVGCEVVRNPISAAGMGSSLACGVRATREAAGWLIALADMPFIGASSYRVVLDALAAGAALARPGFEGQPGHPVGFSASYGEQLASLGGDFGARGVVEAAGANCRVIEVCDSGVLRDIDSATGLRPAPVTT